MAEKHSYPSSERLDFLLGLIHNRAMALPDFQRDFVWDPGMTDELIESVIQNFPAGTLLRVKNGQELLFKPRAFAGAPDVDHSSPVFLVLDGQQRLTSLYQAFYGAGSHRFLLDLAGLEQGLDLEDCCFYDRTEKVTKRFGTIEQQAAALVFPLARLFGEGGFDKWMNEILRARSTTADELLALQERLTAVRNRWLRPIEEYEFPMVSISDKATATAICTIFETLNRTGVKLSVFDLLTARFWPHDIRLRDMWEAAQLEHPILQEFAIDPYYILQIIGLFDPGTDRSGQPKPPSVKRGDILAQSPDQAGRAWEAAVTALADALKILQEDCGVMAARWLPYATIVIPAAASWARQKAVAKGPAVGGNRAKLVRWFWCATLGQRYEYAVNSQTTKDYVELVRWMTEPDGRPPDSVAEFSFHSGSLRTTTPRQRALYRSVMSLVLRGQPRDFHKRGLITPALFGDSQNPVDDHHIFPVAYLSPLGIQTSVRDGILNRTLIDRQTNIRIGKRAPSDYLSSIRDEWGSDADFDSLLASHLLPTGADSSLMKDDLEEFLRYREEAIAQAIEMVTGQKVERNADVEPTVIPREMTEPSSDESIREWAGGTRAQGWTHAESLRELRLADPRLADVAQKVMDWVDSRPSLSFARAHRVPEVTPQVRIGPAEAPLFAVSVEGWVYLQFSSWHGYEVLEEPMERRRILDAVNESVGSNLRSLKGWPKFEARRLFETAAFASFVSGFDELLGRLAAAEPDQEGTTRGDQ